MYEYLNLNCIKVRLVHHNQRIKYLARNLLSKEDDFQN